VCSKISKASRLLLLYPCLSLLPMSLAYEMARFFSPMDRSFQKDYMNHWAQGLQKCLNKGKAFRVNNIKACIKEHITMLSLEALDSCIVPRLHPKQMNRLSKIDGLHHIKTALEQGKGLIIATTHFCRLNMTAYTLGHMGIRNGILSQTVDDDNPYLDWIDRKFLSNKLKRYYRLTMGPGLTLKDSPRRIYRALEKNEIMVILMDAYPDSVKKFYNVPFLGGTLKLPKGIARISKHTGSPLVYSVVRPRGKWGVEVNIRPLPGVGEEPFFQAVREFEKDIKELPCQWWQWAYMNTKWTNA